ncbi:histone lysine demethylase PHF8 isoform X2 [Rhea pennata]|uniref:histone lysine demethylase PHF8 isoform X2 n=1 Tax=Rhea pennata TaxID=8795 RepID=UPI002E26A838
MASVPVYCLCRLPYDVTRFMIECDVCQDWFHGSCVGVEEDAAAEIDLYHCPKCQELHGPSIMKRRRGPTKQPDAEPIRTIRTGSAQFVRELRGRTFPSADEVLLKPSGAQLTVEYLEENSFSVPILVLRKEGLGMTLPPPTFTARDIEHYVGPDKEIDVIDVARQADCRMRLGDFVTYFCGTRRDRVLNVISLEFSDTRLSNLVETPRIVRKLSWVENLWPGESVFERPSVQKYCLMGARDSYTDFHIDFGGTSVWYHVLRGEKVFYLVRPTPANLALFETWSSSSNQGEMFFGDQVDRCYRCPLRQGQTLFIPTGWIHAVLTPVDCLAFGGNFLHSLNIDMQLKAYEIEKRLSTADLFKFPNFETICWYVGKHLLDTFRGLRENRRHPVAYLVHGAKALTTAFRSWTRKEVLAEHEHEIPETVRPGQLIKDLAKEIRLVEDIFQQSMGKSGPPFGLPRPHPEPLGKKGGARKAPPGAGPRRLQPEVLEPEGRRGPARSPELPEDEEEDDEEDEEDEEEEEPEAPSSSPEETDGDSEAAEGELPLGVANGRGARPQRSHLGGRWQPQAPPSPSCSPPSPAGAHSLDLDSEEDLQIDETPPRRGSRRLPRLPRKLPRAKPCSDPNRVREPGEVDFDIEEDYTTEEEEGGAGSAAGILDLLKASRQVGGSEYPQLSEAPASPSTREAIQGMLRMANLPAGTPPVVAGAPGWWATGQAAERGVPGASGAPRRLLPAPRSTDSEDEASPDEHDSLGACFKDAEYIYPSLESDEDDPALKSLPKKKKVTDDAPWSPKARVTPTLPRQSRPVREGTRVASVETGLAAAAAKLAQQEHRKLQRRKGPVKRRPPSPPSTEPEPEAEPEPQAEPEAVAAVSLETAELEAAAGGGEAEGHTEPPPYPPSLADHEYTARPGLPGRAPAPMAPGVFLSGPRRGVPPPGEWGARTGGRGGPEAPRGPPGPVAGPGRRPRKGLATAKQRLGRILKIHRNGKLLL